MITSLSMKVTAKAPANLGLIKYWGRKDEKLRLPENGSISVNLSNLISTTTVEFSSSYEKDEIIINKELERDPESRTIKHLDRMRNIAGVKTFAKVVSHNNFPTSTGLSSSSSGFAALTLAGTKALGLNLSEKQLSILARQGSGSACRSIPDGFVEWLDGESSETSYAVSIFPPDYWDIVDVVAVVSERKKDVSSAEGQKLVNTSLFFDLRKARIKDKISLVKQFIKEKNFGKFGELVETEALELHAIMITSNPSLIYWTPGTLKIMKMAKIWRSEGLPVYFTINTGQDIHLLTEGINYRSVVQKLRELKDVKEIIINKPTIGARLFPAHLF